MTRTIMFISVFLLLAAKCQEEELPPANNTGGNQDLRTVKVTAKHYYQIQPTRKDSLVPGVEVKLFLSEYDRDQDINPDGIQTTDANGQAVFKARDDSFYYVRSYDPVLGVKDEEVKTPVGTISLVEIWYY